MAKIYGIEFRMITWQFRARRALGCNTATVSFLVREEEYA